jgi:hypothetical protein
MPICKAQSYFLPHIETFEDITIYLNKQMDSALKEINKTQNNKNVYLLCRGSFIRLISIFGGL